MSTAFATAYRQLNPDQKTAVDQLDGPVMVIAGPGTGKTQVLTIRIANILQQTDTPPGSILALTFTESGAQTMRRRLIQFIGTAAYRVRIETFHAFCDDVIRSHPECFPLPLNSEPLSDIEKFQLFEQLLQTLPLTQLRTANSPFHYLKPLIKAISDLKREGITPDRYRELVEAEEATLAAEAAELKKTALSQRQRQLGKMQEIGLVFASYQELLRQRKRYDYDDMIGFVVGGFQQQPELLAEYQERFLYILVDEYQDTNAAQNTVVDLLASYWGEAANVCVVGDPHQSIFRFQGASLENTLGFLHRYPTAKLVTLRQAYRSPQAIYDAAAAVISHNPGLGTGWGNAQFTNEKVVALEQSLNRPLESQSGLAAKSPSVPLPAIRWAKLPSDQHEQLWLVTEVQSLLQQGVDPTEIAILYRNNQDSVLLQETFAKYGLPVAAERQSDALASDTVQQVRLLLETLARLRDGRESQELAQLLLAPWTGLARLPVMQLLRLAGQRRQSAYQLLQAGYQELVAVGQGASLAESDFLVIADWLQRLLNWSAEEASRPLCHWLETLLDQTGFLQWIQAQPDKLLRLEELAAFTRFVRQFGQEQPSCHLEELLAVLATMTEHHLTVPVDLTAFQEVGVTFSTVHKAKGQEWHYVFVIQCLDGRWGNSRAGRSLPLPAGILEYDRQAPESSLDDDRRLFYVALTRARQQVTISSAESTLKGQQTKVQLESQFVHEVPAELLTVINVNLTPAALAEFLRRTTQPVTERNWKGVEQEWMRQVLTDWPLSLSALNSYLRDPGAFLLKYILKVPELPDANLGFGTAVHAALEGLYRRWLERQTWPSEAELFAQFTQALRREQLPPDEFDRHHQRGVRLLQQYLQRPLTETKPLFVERKFGYGQHTTMLGDIRLTGRIDRADWLDQAAGTIQVVDYKTGRSRTLNEITGKVGTEDYSARELALPEPVRGAWKRQLLFYKLLLELDPSHTGQVVSGVFEYVEPDRDGKVVARRLPLLDDEVAVLKELILEVMTEIRQLRFLTSSL